MLQNTITFRNVDICLPDITSRKAETQIRLKNVWCKALNKDSSYLVFFVDCSGLLGSTFSAFSPFSSLTALADPVWPSSESLMGVPGDKLCMKAGSLFDGHRE